MRSDLLSLRPLHITEPLVASKKIKKMKEDKLTNTIKSITIDGLFEIFDYKIEYPTSDNVLIVTGPNGFGKTQVLNIIFNLFNRNFLYFNKLVFDEIVIVLSNNFSITIDKKSNLQSEIEFEPKDDHLVHEKNRELKFIFRENENEIETFNYSINISNNLIKQIDHFLPVARVGPDQWVDHRTDQIFNLEEVIRKYSNELPGEISKNILKIEHDRTIQILNSIDVHLIKEQRLFKKIANRDKHYRSDRDRSIMIETIQTYASELTKLISEKSQQSYIVTQALDSTYPNRLVSEKNKISKEEYD